MSNQHVAGSISQAVVSLLMKYKLFLVVPFVVTTGAAVVYSVSTPKQWAASQSIVIRDEVFKDEDRSARFQGGNELTIAQETILEVARSHAVIEAALKEIGPERTRSNWPTVEDIEDTQESIDVSTPNGAEFGRTEVLVISVEASSQQRAADLTQAIVKHLDHHLHVVRQDRAQSLVSVLEKNAALAQNEADVATARLAKLEKSVGGDIGELRSLSQDSGAVSTLQQWQTTLTTELRDAQLDVQREQYFLKTIGLLRKDPSKLLVTPPHLLQSQPALAKIHDGLVQAELNTAALLGEMQPDHPRVQAALISQQTIRNNLRSELATAAKGIENSMHVKVMKVNKLQENIDAVKKRIALLSAIRANYANLAAEVQHREEILMKARQDLSDAKGNAEAATTASVITKIDKVRASDRPVGLGRTTIVAGGAIAGLAIGIGLLFFVVPSNELKQFQMQAQAGDVRSSQPVTRVAVAAEHSQSSQIKGGMGLRDALMKAAHHN